MKKKISPKFIVLAIILGLAAYFGVKKIIFSLTHETTDNGQVDTQIVPVLSRVSGYVKALYVKDFDSVSKGQLVAEIDDAELQTHQLGQQLAARNYGKPATMRFGNLWVVGGNRRADHHGLGVA